MPPSKWTTTSLGEVARFASGGTPSRDNTSYWNGDIPWFSAKDLKALQLLDSEEHISEEGSHNGTRVVESGTVLILVRGMTLLKSFPVGITARRSAFNQDLRAIIPDERLDREFLAYWLLANEAKVMTLVDQAGHGTGRLATDRLADLDISFPPELSEQRAIARLLSVWDLGIKQLSELISAKLHYKQGVTQHILSGKCNLSRPGGEGVVQTYFGDVLEKVAIPIDVDQKTTYREIGIRSHGKGIFHKEPVSGRSLGTKRVYAVVPGCLTLNIVFAWERALAVTTTKEDGMIVSHRFPMFRPKQGRLLPEYALQYLLSHDGHRILQHASPGGAGRNRTLSQTSLLKAAIPIPPIPEQRRFVAFIRIADREISLLRRELDALKMQKKGLMQKLLTGHLRVNT